MKKVLSRKLNLLPFRQNGFALVVTLSLMILLTVIAVGLLGLSSVSLRSSSSSSALAEARANARVSMMMALSQLQLLAGQDTRVTAPSRVVDPSGVPVTGVWRSWEGSDHDSTGRPIAPDYASKKSTGALVPDIAGAGAGRFLGWLTSTGTTATPSISQIPDVSDKAANGFVPLVSSGSVNANGSQVFLKPTMVNNSKGSFAWWVSGDNTKAMINVDRVAKPSSTVAWQHRVRANGRADAAVFGLSAIDNPSKFPPGAPLASTGSLKLVDASQNLKKFHDLTGYSRGLLTNTATGGWKRDLSLMSEKWSALPSSGLSLFTLLPGKEQTYSKAQLNSTSGNPIIYPWANYRNNGTGSGWKQVPPICSWSALVDYTQQYASLISSSASKTAMPLAYGTHGGDGSQRIEFQDKVRRVPQIARIHWIYSIASRRVSGGSAATPVFNPGILVTPVLTLWNPYNVELSFSKFGINIQETAPVQFRLKVGSTVLPDVSLSDISRAGTAYQRFNLKIEETITLPPGATKIFSTTDKTPSINTAANNVILKPGYSPGGGVLFTFIKKSGDTVAEVAANQTDNFEIEKISYDALTDEGGKKGLGIIYDVSVNGQGMSAARMIYDSLELGGQAIVDSLYPPLTNKVSASISSIEVTTSAAGEIKSRPFASALFGYRMASPLSREPQHRHLFSKGMLQANPLCYYSEIGFGDDSNAVNSMAGTGVYHPVNAPFDFAFQELDGWNDTRAAPQWENTTGSTYIVSGLTPNDGLTRCVVAELPTRPIQSLAELQHFDARNNNPIPPFQFNLIGNGAAHPLFAPNQIFVKTSVNDGMCNDDSYILNHLLFDDWFLSSIHRDLRDFSPSTKRSISTVYQEHLSQTTPLPNRFYVPAPGATLPKIANAAIAVLSNSKDALGRYPFETVASKLEVEGMFNVNSVSEDAWKAILRQSRGVQVPYLGANGSTSSGNTSGVTYPRTSIAGEQGTDSRSSSSGLLFPDSVEFAGHRVLTDTQVDALAGEIVREIQKRGPFLSLSEFVNRQLTTDKDLAIASTIQKALDNLANSGASSTNPFANLQKNAVNITAPPPGKTDYKFPEAALGSSAYGVPGWIRQADILKPLAPVLSARDDTFTIRAYGDSREKGNSSKILARAWCEVVVQRRADYVDPSEAPGVAPQSTLMKSAVNKRFGRRFEIVSFRWLNEKEV